jgi:hypothetical protein
MSEPSPLNPTRPPTSWLPTTAASMTTFCMITGLQPSSPTAPATADASGANTSTVEVTLIYALEPVAPAMPPTDFGTGHDDVAELPTWLGDVGCARHGAHGVPGDAPSRGHEDR